MASEKYLWYWASAKHPTNPYDEDISRALEAAYRRGEAQFDFALKNYRYRVDFKQMEQINIGTRQRRKVTRSLHSSSAPSFSSPSSSSIYRWYWINDDKVPVPYDNHTNDVLENAYLLKKTECTTPPIRNLMTGKQIYYYIDFTKMVQRHPKSNFLRKIVREPEILMPKGVVWSFRRDSEWVPYSPSHQSLIEKAFRDYRDCPSQATALFVLSLSRQEPPDVIDFAAMSKTSGFPSPSSKPSSVLRAEELDVVGVESCPSSSSSSSFSSPSPSPSTTSPLSSSSSAFNSLAKAAEKECTICFERPVEVALLPCGHSFSCQECANSLKECAICRTKISQVLRIYFS